MTLAPTGLIYNQRAINLCLKLPVSQFQAMPLAPAITLLTWPVDVGKTSFLFFLPQGNFQNLGFLSLKVSRCPSFDWVCKPGPLSLEQKQYKHLVSYVLQWRKFLV
jgi:hypothetical protein